MGVPKDQALRNRQVILDTASRLFRERGVDGVGVADLMKAAGFTHGGFYNHFNSKDALAAEACAAAFADGAGTLAASLAGPPDESAAALRNFVDTYLSSEHCDAAATACPSATLAADAARQGHDMQVAYADGIKVFLHSLTAYFTAAGHPSEQARADAIALLASLVGSLVVARGVALAEPALATEILAATRAHLTPT